MTQPQEAAPDPNGTPEPEAGNPDGQPEPEERVPEDKEAAKYRRRLRDTEAERDQLSERLGVLQRAEAERLAATHLTDGADLWLGGAELEALLSDDGGLDADKVTAVAQELLGSHPHWRKKAPAAPPASSVTANGKIRGDETRTWSELLQNRIEG